MTTSSPSVVRDVFHRRIAGALAPRGFVPNASFTSLKRKSARSVHLVEFSSSQRNVPGHAACHVALFFEDARVRKQSPDWRTGGLLHGPSFAADVPSNVAVAGEADELEAVVLARLAFFDLLDAPQDVLAQVRMRYVPGIVEPVRIVPYLAVHLGVAAALAYGQALLDARPELWPGAQRQLRSAWVEPPGAHGDHGEQIGFALRSLGVGDQLACPVDVVACSDSRAAHARCFFGRQLRAWGEPAAAAELRRMPDADVLALRAGQEANRVGLVDSVPAVTLLLAATTGVARDPARAAPSPRYFQYFAKHATFASS